ncbi:hypothetical protein FH190_12345 [Staphylococcus warneri]|nr:hypothetical protein [Staphylococcus warneri]MCI2768063.1 hypothetical protein [Staphylococcus warneri]
MAIISITWLNESFGYYQLVDGLFIIIAVVALTTPKKSKYENLTNFSKFLSYKVI